MPYVSRTDIVRVQVHLKTTSTMYSIPTLPTISLEKNIDFTSPLLEIAIPWRHCYFVTIRSEYMTNNLQGLSDVYRKVYLGLNQVETITYKTIFFVPSVAIRTIKAIMSSAWMKLIGNKLYYIRGSES